MKATLNNLFNELVEDNTNSLPSNPHRCFDLAASDSYSAVTVIKDNNVVFVRSRVTSQDLIDASDSVLNASDSTINGSDNLAILDLPTKFSHIKG